MVLKYKNLSNKYYNIKEVAKAHFHISDKLLVKLKNKQMIYLNGNTATVNTLLSPNDIIEFNLSYPEESENIVPSSIPLEIIYEDDALLIVNKDSGIPVHPSINHYEDSLSNGIKYYFNQINLRKKIRPVNRLDKDTSGLVVFAKNEYVQENLIRQMQNGSFKKEYIAILDGILENKSGEISLPIARKERKYYRKRSKFRDRPRSYHIISSFKRK